VAWAADVRSDDSPLEAGLGFAVDLEKEELIAGPALRRQRDAGLSRRLTWFASEADAVMHGTELIAAADGTLSSVRSAGWGFTVQRWLLSAYLPVHALTSGSFEVEVAGRRYPAVRLDAPPYDPTGTRPRS
jgi:sarcosine dehydrogenase